MSEVHLSELAAEDLAQLARWGAEQFGLTVARRYASGLISHVMTLYLPLRAPEGQPPRILGMHKSEETSGYDAGDRKTVFGEEDMTASGDRHSVPNGVDRCIPATAAG